MSDPATPFEPARYLSRIGGADYLEVKFRLLWLRTEHPEAVIETECLFADDNTSRFRCKITLPNGASATGHGSETKGDFRDHYEKSETKAIGRACAALGFGTQFCEDHDFSGGAGRVVDAPVNRTRPPERNASPQRGETAAKGGQEPLVGQGHIARLHAIGKDSAGLDHDGLTCQAYARYGVAHLTELTQREFGAFIKLLERADVIDCTMPPGRGDPIEDNEVNAREFRT